MDKLEPVAWRFWGYNEMNEESWVYSDEWNPYYPRMNAQPLYTAPPQQEFIRLTDEERKEIIRRQKDFWGPVGWELECAKAIEAKLKEKNK